VQTRANTDPDTHCYSYRNAHSDSNPVADPYRDTDAKPHGHSYPDANSNSYTES
jgi:hypothetical protein